MPDPTDAQLGKLLADREVAKWVEAGRSFEEIKNTAAWLYLRRRFTEYQRVSAEAVARRLLRGEDIEPKEIGFAMGYAAAISDMLESPERVDDNLERAAEQAWRRLQTEEAESSESPPYQ